MWCQSFERMMRSFGMPVTSEGKSDSASFCLRRSIVASGTSILNGVMEVTFNNG